MRHKNNNVGISLCLTSPQISCTPPVTALRRDTRSRRSASQNFNKLFSYDVHRDGRHHAIEQGRRDAGRTQFFDVLDHVNHVTV